MHPGGGSVNRCSEEPGGSTAANARPQSVLAFAVVSMPTFAMLAVTSFPRAVSLAFALAFAEALSWAVEAWLPSRESSFSFSPGVRYETPFSVRLEVVVAAGVVGPAVAVVVAVVVARTAAIVPVALGTA